MGIELSAHFLLLSRISWCNLIPLEARQKRAYHDLPLHINYKGKHLPLSVSLSLVSSSLLGPIFSLAFPISISFSLGFARLLSAYIRLPSSLLHSHLLVTLTPCAPLNEREGGKHYGYRANIYTYTERNLLKTDVHEIIDGMTRYTIILQ